MPLNSALNRTIQIGLKFDATSFKREVNTASDSLKVLERSATTAETAISRIKGPGQTPGQAAPATAAAVPEGGSMGGATAVAGRVGSAISAIGPQMSAALQAGLMPLTQISSVMQQQLGIVGGVLQQLAARIEASMKFGTIQSGLTNLQGKIRAAVTSASSANQDGMTRLQAATLALGPAADTAIGAYKRFLSVRSFFGSLRASTDQTGLSLQRLNGITLAAPTAGAAKMTGQFRTMAPAISTVTAGVKGLGLQIGLALGVVGAVYKATQAVVGFFTTGIKGAIDMNETVNKVNETFGDSSGEVTEFAEGLASKFGLVKGPMLDAAASFGLIGRGAKMTTAEAAKMSIQMTQLAVDMTSLHHIPLESSLEKIKSGLTGETKPLKDVGVLMNEDMVKARAMTLAVAEGKPKLDEHAKMMARLSLITEGLATASGDMERTQGEVANQFLAAGGGVKNFATSIGTMLMPVVKTSVVAFNELLASLITVFEDNKPMIETWIDTVKTGFDTVAMVLRNAGDYWTIFKLQTIENLSNVLAYIETIPANLGVMATYIATNWRELIYDGINAVATYFQNLGKNIADLVANIYEFMKDPTSGFNFKFTPLLEGFKATAAQLPEMIKPPLISMQDEIAAAGERIFNREKARSAAMKLQVPRAARPAPIVDEEKKKEEKYHGTAAAEIGTKEAGSSIARFMNEGAPGDTKATANNTKELVKQTKTVIQALREINARGGTQNVGLGTFTI